MFIPGSKQARETAFFLLLVMLATLFACAISTTIDISLYDETSNLDRGRQLWQQGLPPAETSPFYAVWYALLGLFTADNIRLFYLNLIVISVLLPVSAYIFLRSHATAKIPAASVAWLLLISPMNFETQPKVSHLALIVVLLTLAAIDSKRSFLRNTTLATTGALLCSYIRPEYILSYWLLLPLLVMAVINHKSRLSQPALCALTGLALVSLLLFMTLGLVTSGERSINAFGQHYSLRWVYWNHSPLNPWTNWEHITRLSFGNTRSIAGAFFHNPSEFLRHTAANALTLGKGLGLLVLFATAFSALFQCKPSLQRIRPAFASHAQLILLMGIFMVPLIFSVIVIYPRAHYVLPLFSLVFLGMMLLYAGIPENRTQPARIPAALAIFISLSFSLLLWHLQLSPPKRDNLATIRALQELTITRQTNILEAEGGFDIYLGNNFVRIAEQEKSAGLHTFLADRQIDIIVDSALLRNDTRFANDTAWQAFLLNPEAFGYTAIAVPSTDRTIFVEQAARQ